MVGEAEGKLRRVPAAQRRAFRLASVDVFDTVLTRAVGRPSALFLSVGRTAAARDLLGLSPEGFARARVRAESRARARHGECTGLAHIVGELAAPFDLTDEQVDALIAAELATEARLLRAVPGSERWLHELRRSGHKVAFVSDTYLPSLFVRQQLVDKGLWASGDSLYVSCDASSEKWSGRLFASLARTEGYRRWRIRHHGNDPVSDGRSARRAGLQVAPMTAANMNRYEEALEDLSFDTAGLASIFAGASRLARLEVDVASARDRAIRDVAAGVAAPVLVAFVLSVLRDAVRSGLRRLYFVSRDGEILLRIAGELAVPTGFDGELRYLYGSRKAWSLPGLDTVDDRQLEWILENCRALSLPTVLARVAMAPPDIAPTLVDNGFPPVVWPHTLSRADCRRLRLVLSDAKVAALAVRRAAELRPAVVRYLRSAGLTDGSPSGVVDVGWFGRTGAALCRLLAGAGAEPPDRLYYFGLHRSPPQELRGRTRPYLLDGEKDTGPDLSRMPGMVNLLETFCTGTHGPVVGYDEVGPILMSMDNPAADEWGLPILRSTVDRFLANLELAEASENLDADLRPAVTAVLQTFVASPSRAEAEAWGSILFSDDQHGALLRPLAQRYRVGDIVAGLVQGFTAAPLDRQWPSASRRLSTPLMATMMGRPYELALRVKDRLSRYQ